MNNVTYGFDHNNTIWYGISPLLRMQNFPNNQLALPPDTHTLCAYQGVRKVSFSENFTYVLNEIRTMPKKIPKNGF